MYSSYAHKLRAAAVSSPGGSSAKKPAAASPARKPASPARKPAAPQQLSSKSIAAAGVVSRLDASRKPCPASRKPGGGVTAGPGGGSAPGSPRRSAVLPKGWRNETRTVKDKEVVVYFSPDGREFPVGGASIFFSVRLNR